MSDLLFPKSQNYRKTHTQSALGDYSHPTISSQKKARSRSASQKSRVITKRPTSKYIKNNLITDNREQTQLSFPKGRYSHILVAIEQFRRGFTAILTNEKQQVSMKVFHDHVEIEQNSVNQTLNIQPIASSIKKIKIGFGEWSQDLFSIRIKSFEGRINPNHIVTDAIALFSDDVMSIDPFLMIEEAELLRKKMLLRMNSKRATTQQQLLREMREPDNQIKQIENPLTRKSSLKVGLGPGLKPSYIHINRAIRKPDENSLLAKQNLQAKKNQNQPIERALPKYTFKRLRQESKTMTVSTTLCQSKRY